MKKITVKEIKPGRYILINIDGYSTTNKIFQSQTLAERAREREQKKIDEGKPSRMVWIY